MTHRLATNYAKNYCNRTPIVKVIVENVVTCFFGTRCSNFDVSATVFEILTLKARKSPNFLTPPFFEALVRGNPLEFGDEIWRQKTRNQKATSRRRNHAASFLRFDTIPARDRRTDGQTRCDHYYPR